MELSESEIRTAGKEELEKFKKEWEAIWGDKMKIPWYHLSIYEAILKGATIVEAPRKKRYNRRFEEK